VGKSTHWLHLDPWWRGGYGSIKTLCGRHVTIESRHGEVTATLKWERLQRKPILTDVCVRCLTVTAAHRRDTFPGTPADFRGPAIYYHIDGGPEYLEEELRKKDERQARHEAAKKEAMEQAWRDAGLDFYQAHWYEHLERRAPLARPVSDFKLDRPVMLGEFPSRRAAGELQRILETARAAGYSGAYVWSVLATDAATDFATAEAVLKA